MGITLCEISRLGREGLERSGVEAVAAKGRDPRGDPIDSHSGIVAAGGRSGDKNPEKLGKAAGRAWVKSAARIGDMAATGRAAGRPGSGQSRIRILP